MPDPHLSLNQQVNRHTRFWSGTGQTRGYIDIRNTMCCIELAIPNPPERGEYRVFNQITTIFTQLTTAALSGGDQEVSRYSERCHR